MPTTLRELADAFRYDSLSLAAAADWLEERHAGTNAEILAAWLRAGEMPPWHVRRFQDCESRGGRGRGGGSGTGVGLGRGHAQGSGGGRGDGQGRGISRNEIASSNNRSGPGHRNQGGRGFNSGGGDGTGGGDGHSSDHSLMFPEVTPEDYDVAIEVGDYVCVRSDQQGVVWGFYAGGHGRERSLTEARQQYDWDRNALTLFDLAANGPADTGLRLSVAVPEILMLEACGVILVPRERAREFRDWPAG